MPQYAYVARSHNGERIEGTLEARDRHAALVQIERMGHVPISLREGALPTAAAAEAGRALPRTRGRRPRMKMREVLVFTRELSDLVAAGMTLGNALNALSRRGGRRGSDVIVADLRDQILQGASLSQALSRWPETFSALYVGMVRAGEASGKLPETLAHLARHYERVQEAREKVAMALVYPGIVLTFGAGVLVFTMVFVVPRFTAIFQELGSTLPAPTRALIRFSELLMKYGWLALAGLVALVYLLRRAVRTPTGRRVWHRLQLRMPLVRRLVTANAFAHFGRTLGALLESGVPVLEALGIVEQTVGNCVIAQEIREARERVTDGSSISGPLAAGKVFPRLLTEMLAVGEQSGNMVGALSHITRRYDGELDRSVKVLTTILEPLLIVIMAALVGYVAISMLLAVFDLTSGLNV